MARKASNSSTYRLVGTYQRLRKQLLELPDDGRLDKQLAFWVLPSDRRLPIAFLDRDMRSLLSASFDELLNTPGVGHKKMEGLFALFRRAAKAGSDETPFGLEEPNTKRGRGAGLETEFDPAEVSESLWAVWCDTVTRHDFTSYKLGQLAPTLQSLPTVIWHKTLGEYACKSLADIRRMRTHGEKRVQAIIEVFRIVHESISTSAPSENLELQLVPRFVPPLVRWLGEAALQEKPPTLNELRRCLVSPLVKQIETDLGEIVAELAAERLEPGEGAPSVKQQASRLGVTRARVYQLLEDCSKVMEVRWPTGRWLLLPLEARSAESSPRGQQLIRATCELFFPRETAVLSSVV